MQRRGNEVLGVARFLGYVVLILLSLFRHPVSHRMRQLPTPAGGSGHASKVQRRVLRLPRLSVYDPSLSNTSRTVTDPTV